MFEININFTVIIMSHFYKLLHILIIIEKLMMIDIKISTRSVWNKSLNILRLFYGCNNRYLIHRLIINILIQLCKITLLNTNITHLFICSSHISNQVLLFVYCTCQNSVCNMRIIISSLKFLKSLIIIFRV